MDEYCKPRWYRTVFGDMVWFPGGNIPVGIVGGQELEDFMEENDMEWVKLPWRAYALLKDWMLENDQDRIIVSNREEDLKVIHRLLDIQEKMIK